jgi:PAS domain S-box-containing protein
MTEIANDLSRVVDALPGLVWTALPDGRIDFINQRWSEYTGLSIDEGLDWGWQTAIHSQDLPELVERWRSILASGEPREMEARLRRFDGEYRWFLVRAFPLPDASGQIAKWCGMNTDIEDRKRAEAMLAGEKRLLEMIAKGDSLSAILTELCLLAEEFCAGYVFASILLSDQETQELEYAASPNVPKAYTDSIEGLAIGPDVGSCGSAVYDRRQVIAEDIATDPRWAGSRGLALANGLRACWCTPIFSQQNRVLGTLAIFSGKPGSPTPEDQEVIAQIIYLASIAIERVQSDTALKSSEARKAAILDSALDCIVTIDHEGRITEFNPAAERTFGYRQDEVVGKRLSDVIVPPSLRDAHMRGFARYLGTGEARVLGKRIELPAIRADGTEFPVELAITRIPLDGRPSFTGYLRDITERKQSEVELRRAEADLRKSQAELAHVTRVTTMGELAASIAHEVNQPISGVVLNSNACLRWLANVKEDSPNIAQARESLHRITRDGRRAGEIVTRIRALFQKSESAKEPFDLNEAVREIIVLAKTEMDKQRVTLCLELGTDLSPALGDKVQVQQVILNLILNAIDAMNTVDDRNLNIRTQSRMEGDLMATVRDSGIGLDPANMEKIFTAFHTTKPRGLGMGLSISRSIVENHHGQLWVTTHEGPGASFHFTLLTASRAEL